MAKWVLIPKKVGDGCLSWLETKEKSSVKVIFHQLGLGSKGQLKQFLGRLK